MNCLMKNSLIKTFGCIMIEIMILMFFTVGVYLTNPLEIVPENVIMDQLTSDSVLLVRRHDVVSRFRDWCPLNEILKQRDSRWRTMNVIGRPATNQSTCMSFSYMI